MSSTTKACYIFATMACAAVGGFFVATLGLWTLAITLPVAYVVGYTVAVIRTEKDMEEMQ